MDAAKILSPFRIVPVVVIEDVETAVPLATTLAAAGLGAIEVTLRTAPALEAIRRIASEVPGILPGAGSIRTPEQMQQAGDAGARFCVSPGSSPKLLAAARDLKMAFVPGAVTASEMIALMEAGYTLQKFFPAELAGGAAMIRSVGGPLPEVRFFPTGGITTGNAGDYLALKNVACIGGSWLAPRNSLADRDFDAIAQLAEDAVKLTV